MFLQEEKRPKVGIGVILMRDGKVLIGKRRGSHGEGRWGFPGGHLEWGESFEECAIRELEEETGIVAKDPKFISATNDIMSFDEKHYITIFMLVEQFEGEPRVLESDKVESWHWFDWDDLPEPRFLPIDNLIAAGYHPEGNSMTQEERAVIQKTKQMVKEQFQHEGSGHDWWHIYRVWKNAKAIAKQEEADQFIVELAALLHDIADWKDHDGDLEAGPKAASEWLQRLNVAPNSVEHVADIVRTISFKGAGVIDAMNSIEGKIVQDADRLDAMGAIGIGRTFTWGGSRARLMYDPGQQPGEHLTFDDYKKNVGHTVNHFYEKLLLLKDRMNTETGRKIAESRHKFMEEFLEQFYKEWDGKDGLSGHRYNKLVRDRIPEIVEQNGEHAEIHIADHDEYTESLRDKLREEVEEFLRDNDESELADVLEVVRALSAAKGISFEELERIRKSKREERGGFDNRVILEETR